MSNTQNVVVQRVGEGNGDEKMANNVGQSECIDIGAIPDIAFSHILSFLSYDEVSQIRLVNKR